jgi:hypothetical protein
MEDYRHARPVTEHAVLRAGPAMVSRESRVGERTCAALEIGAPHQEVEVVAVPHEIAVVGHGRRCRALDHQHRHTARGESLQRASRDLAVPPVTEALAQRGGAEQPPQRGRRLEVVTLDGGTEERDVAAVGEAAAESPSGISNCCEPRSPGQTGLIAAQQADAQEVRLDRRRQQDREETQVGGRHGQRSLARRWGLAVLSRSP